MRSTLVNLEESCTVADTTARTRDPTDNLGYYNYLKGDPRSLYEQDRETMISGKPLRGMRAVDRVNETFEDTNISDLRVRNSGRNPKRTIEEGRSSGKYPPRKTAKKTNPKGGKRGSAPTATVIRPLFVPPSTRNSTIPIIFLSWSGRSSVPNAGEHPMGFVRSETVTPITISSVVTS